MTENVTAWFEKAYIPGFIERFKTGGNLLKGTVSEPTKIIGNKAEWKIAGHTEAQLFVRGSKAVPQNPERTTVEAIMDTWQVFTYEDEDDITKMGVRELDISRQNGIDAMGRRFDKNVIKAIADAAATPVLTDTTNGLNLENMLEIVTICNGSEAPANGDWYVLLPSRLWSQAMSLKQFSSSDWIGADLPLKKKTHARSWGGVNWIMVPDNYLGLTKAQKTGDVTLPVYHKNAIGLASDYNLKMTSGWNDEMSQTSLNHRMSGATKVLLTEGVFRCKFNLNATLAGN